MQVLAPCCCEGNDLETQGTVGFGRDLKDGTGRDVSTSGLLLVSVLSFVSAVELEALCVLSQLQSLRSRPPPCAPMAPRLGAGGSAPTQQLCTASLKKGETFGSGSVSDT